MSRRPHHRGPYGGKDDRGRVYHLNRLFACVAASRRLALDMQPVGAGLYRMTPGVVLGWRAALDDAVPYLDDDEGRVRL